MPESIAPLSSVSFDAETLEQFAKESGDVNPLHMDETYARKTAFGQRVAFGALGGLACLGQLPVRTGWRLSDLAVEFRNPLFLGIAFQIQVEWPRDSKAIVTLSDGDLMLVQLVAGFEEVDVAASHTGLAPQAGEIAPTMVALRTQPQILDEEALAQGITLESTYQAQILSDHFPEAQLALRLASYMIGMEVPGRRALFSKLSLHFPVATAEGRSDEVVQYRCALKDYDETFGAVQLDLKVWSDQGVRFEGELSAFMRKDLSAAARADSQTANAQILPQPDTYFQGKTALVIGGSRGLGAAFVRALAWRGCTVIVNFLSSAAEADALVASLAQAPGWVDLLQGDGGDPAWCAKARDEVQKRFGHLDLLVLNACAPPVTLGSSVASQAVAERYIATNHALVAAPLTAFLPDIKAKGGAVVAVSSSLLESDAPEWPHYRKLKEGIEALLQEAAAHTPDVSFLLPRPPALLTEMSDTPLRAAQALAPETIVEHVVLALKEKPSGTATVLSDFSEEALAAAKTPKSADAIMVAATFTHMPMEETAAQLAQALSCGASVALTAYGQLFRDLLDHEGALVSNRQGLNAILIRVEDWLRNASEDSDHGPDQSRAPTQREKQLLEESASAFIEALTHYSGRARCVTAILLCPASEPETQHPEWRRLFADAETALMARLAAAVPEMIQLRAADFHQAYAVTGDFHDPVRDELGHIPYSGEYFNVLSTLIFRCYFYARVARYKVFAVDCDNTIWGGVCGEVGPKAVDLGGRFHALQTLLAEQAQKGVLICLCSKNVEEDVWAVFDANPSMPLRREHIVDSRINWERKSQNIQSLASALNLGVDSFVFLDDSPVECAEVRAACPEVSTIQWPTEEKAAQGFLNHLWVFDRFLTTSEDVKRSESYKSQVKRGKLRANTKDFTTFLENLNLTIDVRALDEADLPRASQLTQRTNQFNLTTERKTVGEIRGWLEDPNHEAWTVRVHDRFGDYGLVGLMLLQVEGEALAIETFLLSCRVLSRGVEHRMLAQIGDRAQDRGLSQVKVRFAETKKNRPARMFLNSVLPDMAAQEEKDFACVYDTDFMKAITYKPAKTEDEDEETASATGAPDEAAVLSARARERQLLAAVDLGRLEALAQAVAPAVTSPEQAHKISEGAAQAKASPALDLRALFATVLNIAPEDFDPEERFDHYGIDSMRIVELTVALKRTYKDLPVTFLFEHKTLASVAKALAKRYPDSAPLMMVPAAPKAVETVASVKDDHIAIIGMNGRFPGAPDVTTYWNNLKAGRCAIDEIPEGRWPVDAFFDPAGGGGKSYSKVGGFLQDIDQFDAGFFHISSKEAELMDPQQRMMLQCVWGLLEDAGYTRETLDRDTGVFIGALSNDYATYANSQALETGSAYRNADFYQIPNRVSYFFDLHGPSLSIDTACSASGTAMYFACQSLRTGACKTAIVGGINLFLHPSRFIQYAQMQMISPSAKCRPFGAGADGTLFGEGLGTVLLKPLAQAEADGDNIHGVILGCNINSGGKANGFTVPDPEAQAALIAQALREAGVASETMGYIEAHGTGTPLGDPIELRGLTMAFEETLSPDAGESLCALGSVKANIGHLESAAGMAGMIKTLLQLRHKTLVPSLNAKDPNPEIRFEETPFRVQKDLAHWTPKKTAQGNDLPRRAGISSFGAGGSNAHMVLEEAPQKTGPSTVAGPHIIPLSAHREAALRDVVDRFVTFLRSEEGLAIALADMALTLQIGREAMRKRLAIVAESHEDLANRLEHWLSHGEEGLGERGAQGSAAPTRGKAKGAVLAVAHPEDPSALMDMARGWVTGAAVDWQTLYSKMEATKRPRRVSLPTYPFAGARHWLPGAPNLKLGQSFPTAEPTSAAQPASAVDTEPKAQARQATKVFQATEPVICDHQVQGRAILPGVAYLQTALEAGTLAHETRSRIERVVWAHPFALETGEKALTIALEPQEEGGTRFVMRTEGAEDAAPHVQGVLHPATDAIGGEPPKSLAVEQIRGRCPIIMDHWAIYHRFTAMGIDYGPHFQGVERICYNQKEALGLVVLPEERAGEAAETAIHPTLVDGALQTVLVFATAQNETLLPFALDRLDLYRRLSPRSLVHVTRNGEKGFNITISDEAGQVCATLENLVVRESVDPLGSLFAMPHWEACGAAQRDGDDQPVVTSVITGQSVAIVGAPASQALQEALAESHQGDRVLRLSVGESLADEAALDRALLEFGPLDGLYFLGGLRPLRGDIADPEALAQSEEEGTLSFFRLIKALRRTKLLDKPINVKIATHSVYGLTAEEATLPDAASLLGLAKVAAKEFPRLRVTSLDLERQVMLGHERSDDMAAMARLLRMETENKGEETLIRQGLRYRRILLPVPLPKPKTPPFRQGGTCLILGGAGGIGLALSAHLARTYGANVVWLGRRAETADIAAKKAQIEALGGQVLYLQADAADATALGAAIAQAKERFGTIHGVVHSALVLEDKTLANMDEATFKRAMTPKTRASVLLYDAVRDEPFDFFLFLSSINSFQTAAGQSNYVAGCTFKDAFGQALQSRVGKDQRVRVINWGYWGSVGVVASEAYRARIAAEGHGSIEPAEGMAMIERILAQPLPQIVALKATADRRARIGIDDRRQAHVQQAQAVSVLQDIPEKCAMPVVGTDVARRFRDAFNALEQLSRHLALSAFQDMGVLKTPGERWTYQALRDQLGIVPEYFALYDAWLDILSAIGAVRITGQEIEATERVTDRSMRIDPDQKARVCELLAERHPDIRERLPLLRVCAEAWADVLQGRRHHMDVVFPGGDLSLVAPIYRGDDITNAYNLGLAALARTYVEARLAKDPKAKITILEVGAGTGGTSRKVLPALADYADHIQYVFTDVSRKFLQDGAENFGKSYPFLSFQLFDFEKDPLAQGFAPASFDLALATNCVHATRSMAGTLGRIKRLMKHKGLLALNEFTTRFDYNTLTFGLTSGWWLFEDPEVRIKGSPLLPAEGWQHVLESLGWRDVRLISPPPAAQGALGQHLILCESDGVAVEAAKAPSAVEARAVKPKRPAHAQSQPVQVQHRGHVQTQAVPATSGEESAPTTRPVAEVYRYVKQIFSTILKTPEDDLEDDLTFDCFGVDSLLSMAILDRFEQDFEALPATLLFEYTTIADLSDYLIAEKGERLAKLLGWAPSPGAQASQLQTCPKVETLTQAPAETLSQPEISEPIEGHIPLSETASYVRKIFSDILKTPEEDLEDDLTFDCFGVDSLLSMAILDRFEQDFGPLPSTLLFEYMTVADLADYLITEKGERLGDIIGRVPQKDRPNPAVPTATPEQAKISQPLEALAPSVAVKPEQHVVSHPVTAPVSTAPVASHAEIAIIGYAGRFPGAEDQDSFWDALVMGRNCVTEIPKDRWDWRHTVDEKGGGRWGGFLSDIDKFDALFFNISPREAEVMSPESRLFLETVWQTIEHAGYAPRTLSAKSKGDVGVFVGCMYQQYPTLFDDADLRGDLSSGSYWSIANRVSYALNFAGPSMAVDTACASALTALHMACESIRHGESAVAIAGGVNLSLDPGKFKALRRLGMLGSSAESRSLGDGDGLIPSEGVGAVLLKPLAQAVADQDNILGVIKGSAVNNCGRTSGFNMPSPNAQADLVAKALERAGTHPETISYVEVAANGSALGDPVEVVGLTKAFQRQTDKSGFCAIGAVKSNFGHPEAASGMAQLAKVLLQLQRRALVPSLHADPINPKLALEGSPFYIQKSFTPWDVPDAADWQDVGVPKRRAAISSFGAGGSNAHVIVEEYSSAQAKTESFEAQELNTEAEAGPQLFVLSARTEDQLVARAQDLIDFLNKTPEGKPGFAEIAYTLQTGREVMRMRFACVATDRAALIEKLSTYCTAMEQVENRKDSFGKRGLYAPAAGQNTSAARTLLDDEDGHAYVARVIAGKNYEKIAHLWSLGIDINWDLLQSVTPRKCLLPGYPFARKSHWVGQDAPSEKARGSSSGVPQAVPASTLQTAAPQTAAQAYPSALAPLRPLTVPLESLKPAKTNKGLTPPSLETRLKVVVGDILKIPMSEIELDVELREYGLDSINLAQFATQVNVVLGLNLTVDAFFSYPTLSQCAAFLSRTYPDHIKDWQAAEMGLAPEQKSLDEMPMAQDADRAVALSPSLGEELKSVTAPLVEAEPLAKQNRTFGLAAERDQDQPIAIIGLAGMMPQSDDLTEFWQHLMAGHTLISDMPADRLALMGLGYAQLCQQVEAPMIKGGFLNQVDAFDSLFFGISPKEASLMDPQQRLLLETVWKTIEDAGYATSDLAGSDVGVFVGASNYDYSKLYQQKYGQPLAHASTGMMVNSILANRISYHFDFHGPSDLVDTACSSGLVAIHRAAEAIRKGECDIALASAVNVLLDWHGYAVLRQAGIFSPNGQVRLFCADGAGYVRGEGVGAVLLKPLDRALVERDQIYAVIRGSATNFDGKSYSLTAPSPVAQTKVVREALRRSGVDPRLVRHIEAQGTGLPFSDPVEVNAFTAAFAETYQDWGLSSAAASSCSLGYLKPQIGHLEAASSMAGLTKILLAMRQNQIPGTCNLDRQAMTLDLTEGPFFLTENTQSWAPKSENLEPSGQEGPGQGTPRQGALREGGGRFAALHSFGLGGVNAHLVLEDGLIPADKNRNL